MHYPKTALGVCTIAHFMNDGMTVVLSIILPFLISKYGLSYYQAGLIVTCFYVTQTFIQPLLGYASDRTGGRKIYLGLGLILFSISLYGLQFAQTYALALTLALLAGIGATFYHPQGTAIVSEAYPNRRGFALGVHGSGGSAGNAFYPMMIAFIASLYGWPASLAPVLALGLLGGLATIVFLKDTMLLSQKRSLRTELSSALLILTLVALLRSFSYSGMVNFIPTFFVRERGLDITIAASFTSIMLGAGIASQPLGGYFSDKVSRRILLGASLLALSICFPCSMIATYPTSLVLLAASGLALFMSYPIILAIAGDIVPNREMGTAIGIVFGLGHMGGNTIAPIVVGKAADYIGLGQALLLMSAFSLIGAVFCILLPKRKIEQ